MCPHYPADRQPDRRTARLVATGLTRPFGVRVASQPLADGLRAALDNLPILGVYQQADT